MSRLAALARRAALAVLLGLAAVPAWAQVNGLWSSSRGDYLLFLQDSSSGTTFSIQVPAALDAIKVWIGSGSPASVSLQGVLNADDRLAASVNGSAMSGSVTQAGVQSTFDARLALGWVANAHAGVWQKSAPANAYLVFCVLETGSGRIGLQVDVTLDPVTRTYRYDIYSGVLAGSTYTGASLAGSGTTSRLVFGNGTLSGTQTTVQRPVQSIEYTATQIVGIGG